MYKDKCVVVFLDKDNKPIKDNNGCVSITKNSDFSIRVINKSKTIKYVYINDKIESCIKLNPKESNIIRKNDIINYVPIGILGRLFNISFSDHERVISTTPYYIKNPILYPSETGDFPPYIYYPITYCSDNTKTYDKQTYRIGNNTGLSISNSCGNIIGTTSTDFYPIYNDANTISYSNDIVFYVSIKNIEKKEVNKYFSYCSKCGYKRKDGDNFCPVDGTSLTKS